MNAFEEAKRPCVNFGLCGQLAVYLYRRHPRGRSRERWLRMCSGCVKHHATLWMAMTILPGPFVEPLP